MSKLKTVWIVRHGETTYNKMGIIQGQYFNSPLTINGLNQCVSYANTIKSNHLNNRDIKIYSSPLGRCLQTSSIIKEVLSCSRPISVANELIELNYDKMSGLTKKEAFTMFPEEVSERESDKWSTKTPHDGESYQDVFERVSFWLSSIHEEEIITIGHGGSIKAVYGALMGSTQKEMLELSSSQNIIYKISVDDNVVKSQAYNCDAYKSSTF